VCLNQINFGAWSHSEFQNFMMLIWVPAHLAHVLQAVHCVRLASKCNAIIAANNQRTFKFPGSLQFAKKGVTKAKYEPVLGWGWSVLLYGTPARWLLTERFNQLQDVKRE